MAGKLEGRVALVTSAGQGIGRASAIALAREGATVFATDIREDLFKDISKEHPGITGFGLNVLEQPAVDAALKRTGPIDILFNCSGFVHNGTVLDCEEKDWDFSFDLNVKSMHRTIQAFLPGMLGKGQGAIVNIASGASSVRGIPFRYAYGTTKAAVIGLSKAVAADFMKQGIRCNAICPGTVQSPSLDDRIAALAKSQAKPEPEVRQAFVDRQPMGRLGTAEEIATADPALLGTFQICDAPRDAPPPAELVAEARTRRLLPGDGGLALWSLIDALPPDIPVGVELPIAGQFPDLDPQARANLMVKGTREFFQSRRKA